jgi:hypothetical protein
MKRLASLLGRLGLLRPELDYPVIRVTLLINFLFFGGWQWAIALLLLLDSGIRHSVPPARSRGR